MEIASFGYIKRARAWGWNSDGGSKRMGGGGWARVSGGQADVRESTIRQSNQSKVGGAAQDDDKMHAKRRIDGDGDGQRAGT